MTRCRITPKWQIPIGSMTPKGRTCSSSDAGGNEFNRTDPPWQLVSDLRQPQSPLNPTHRSRRQPVTLPTTTSSIYPLRNWDQSSWSQLSSARSTSTSSVSTTPSTPSWNAPSSSTPRLAWWVSSSRSRWSPSPPDTFWGVTCSVSISTREARLRERLKCESLIESFFLSICTQLFFFFITGLSRWVLLLVLCSWSWRLYFSTSISLKILM